MSSSTFSRSLRNLPGHREAELSTQSARRRPCSGPPIAICWMPRTRNGRVVCDAHASRLVVRSFELEDHLSTASVSPGSPSTSRDHAVLRRRRGCSPSSSPRSPRGARRRAPPVPAATATSTSRPGIGDSRNFDRSGGALHRHQRIELGRARRQHARLELRTAVRDPVAAGRRARSARGTAAVARCPATTVSRSAPSSETARVRPCSVTSNARPASAPSPASSWRRAVASATTTTKSSPIRISWPGSWPVMRAARVEQAPVDRGREREQEVGVRRVRDAAGSKPFGTPRR